MRLIDLIEGRDAPLYHGTQMLWLLMILHDDSLGKGAFWDRPNEPDGPRLTRNFRVAGGFAEDGGEYGTGGILELDQTKLAQRYKIVPYADVDGQNGLFPNEAEEVVITEEIKPLSRYLTAIHVSSEAIDYILNDTEAHEWWAQYELANMYPTPEQVKQAIVNLAKHPLVRGTSGYKSKYGPR